MERIPEATPWRLDHPSTLWGRALRRAGFTLLAALVWAGCGHLTAGGVVEVQLFLSDDDPSFSREIPRSAPATPFPAGGLPAFDLGATRVQGDLTVQVQLEIQDAAGRWFPLTDGPQEVTVTLQGTSQPEIGRTVLDVGEYAAIRASFGRVEAEVTRGLDVNGVPITGRVPVQLPGTGRLVVLHPLDRSLRDGDRLEVLVAMNAQVWLRAAHAQLRSVPPEAFRDAVRIRVR